MFILESKNEKIKTFNLKKAECFLSDCDKEISLIIYNNLEYSIEEILTVILKINGNFILHIKLHNKFLGNYDLKKYIKNA